MGGYRLTYSLITPEECGQLQSHSLPEMVTGVYSLISMYLAVNASTLVLRIMALVLTAHF